MAQNINKQPLLSISFLSCGRAKTIRNCLESLKPIMEALPCELIIVDTGCGEEIAALMREYTEKIVPFTWCNDFSKARNAGLEQATGKWFLYIDDDEWFEDPSEIISFFKSGEYKKYAYACYIQRNYRDYKESRWSDAWVSRMMRLDEDTHFESSIHEYLWPIKGKCKLIDCYVKHFGYVYETEADKIAHAQRNIVPLLDMIEKDPDEARWWAQLAQEYLGILELDKLEKLCLDALEHYKMKSAPVLNAFLGTFYTALIMKNLLQENFEAAEKYYRMALADSRATGMCRAMASARIAESYYKAGQHEECTKCCKEYFRQYNKLKKDEDAQFMQGAFFTEEAFEINIRNNMYCLYIRCCVVNNDVDGFIDYFWKLGWQDMKMHVYYKVPEDIVEGFIVFPYQEKFVKMAQALIERDGLNGQVMTKLQQIEAEEFDKFNWDEAKRFKSLCTVFSKVELADSYIWYLKVLDKAADADLEKVSKQYRRMKAQEKQLFDSMEDGYFEKMTEALKNFMTTALDFYTPYFEANPYKGAEDKLPPQYRAAVRLQDVFAAMEAEDVKAVGDALKRCITDCPQLSDVIQKYTKLYAEVQKAKVTVTPEMQQLALQIKGQISGLLNQGLYAEANSILTQLKTFVPMDAEMVQLEKTIKANMS